MEAAEGAEAAEHRQLAVDSVGDPLLQVGEDRVGLRLRDPPCGNGIVEVVLRLGRHGVDQAVDALAALLRDLRERLTSLQVAPKLRLREAEVVGSRVELEEVAEAVVIDAAEQRDLAG